MSEAGMTDLGSAFEEHGAVRGPGDGAEQVLLTRVGLRIPAGLAYDDWERAGHRLSNVVDSSAWWLGDWLVFGKENYSDRYQRAIRSAGLSYQTLRNYAWVARRFRLDKRHAGLTFQHHAEVASLPDEVHHRLLDEAELNNWSTKQLRAAARNQYDGDRPRPMSAAAGSRIDVPQDRLGTWRRAADSAGLDLERWVMVNLDHAAERALDDGAEAGPTVAGRTGTAFAAHVDRAGEPRPGDRTNRVLAAVPGQGGG